MKILTILGLAIGFIAMYAALVGVSAFIFWLLWNWVLPDLFHWPELRYSQAYGLVLLLSFVGSAIKINTKK